MTNTHSTAHMDDLLMISMIKIGYCTLELATLLVVKLTQKKDIKKTYQETPTRKSTINTSFKNRHYDLSRNPLTL